MGRRALRITADTNLLLRAVLKDNERQSDFAAAVLAKATVIAVPPIVFCEFAWVLRRGRRFAADEIADAITAICDIDAVTTDQGAVDAGLAMLLAGGDFADSVIAQQGRALGGSTFASFDREAVRLLADKGFSAEEPAGLVAE